MPGAEIKAGGIYCRECGRECQMKKKHVLELLALDLTGVVITAHLVCT